MSERKSDEIKFRVEPSVKARWQAAADLEGIALSELIRRAAEREASPGSSAAVRLWPPTVFADAAPMEEERPEAAPLIVKSDWKPFGAVRGG